MIEFKWIAWYLLLQMHCRKLDKPGLHGTWRVAPSFTGCWKYWGVLFCECVCLRRGPFCYCGSVGVSDCEEAARVSVLINSSGSIECPNYYSSTEWQNHQNSGNIVFFFTFSTLASIITICSSDKTTDWGSVIAFSSARVSLFSKHSSFQDSMTEHFRGQLNLSDQTVTCHF